MKALFIFLYCLGCLLFIALFVLAASLPKVCVRDPMFYLRGTVADCEAVQGERP